MGSQPVSAGRHLACLCIDWLRQPWRSHESAGWKPAVRDSQDGYLPVRKPVNGLVAAAAFNFSANPISRASRPASMAFLNAFAMRTGSEAIAIAVFTS